MCYNGLTHVTLRYYHLFERYTKDSDLFHKHLVSKGVSGINTNDPFQFSELNIVKVITVATN